MLPSRPRAGSQAGSSTGTSNPGFSGGFGAWKVGAVSQSSRPAPLDPQVLVDEVTAAVRGLLSVATPDPRGTEGVLCIEGDQQEVQISALRSAVDRVLRHGLKGSFWGSTTEYWGLLERFSRIYQPMARSVSSVAELSSDVRTAAGRGVAWISFVLVERSLAVFIAALTSYAQLQDWYEPWGLMRADPDMLSTLLTPLYNLSSVNFSLYFRGTPFDAIAASIPPPTAALSVMPAASPSNTTGPTSRRTGVVSSPVMMEQIADSDALPPPLPPPPATADTPANMVSEGMFVDNLERSETSQQGKRANAVTTTHSSSGEKKPAVQGKVKSEERDAAEGRMAAKDSEIDRMRGQIETQWRPRVEHLSRELVESTRCLQILEKDVETQRQQLSSQSSELEKLRSLLEATQQEASRMRSLAEQKEQRCVLMEQELGHLKEVADCVEKREAAAMRVLKEELTSAKEATEKAEARAVLAEASMEKLSAANKDLECILNELKSEQSAAAKRVVPVASSKEEEPSQNASSSQKISTEAFTGGLIEEGKEEKVGQHGEEKEEEKREEQKREDVEINNLKPKQNDGSVEISSGNNSKENASSVVDREPQLHGAEVEDDVALDEEVDRLRADIRRVQEICDHEMDSLVRSHEIAMSEMESQLKSNRQEIETLRFEAAVVNGQLKAQESEIDAFETRRMEQNLLLSQSSSDVARLRAEVERLRSELEKVHERGVAAQNAALEAKLSKKRTKLRQTRSHVEELEGTVAQCQTELERHEEAVGKLESLLAQREEALQEMREQNYPTRLETLTHENRQLEAEVEVLLITVDSKNDEIRRSLLFSEQTILTARRAVEDMEVQQRALETERDALRQELVRAEAQVADVSEEQKSKFEGHIRDLYAAMTTERERVTVLKQMLNLKSKDELELKEQLIQTQSEVAARSKDVETVRLAEQKLKEYVNERLDLAEKEAEQLRADLKAQVAETQQLRQELKVFRSTRALGGAPAQQQDNMLMAPWTPDIAAECCAGCDKGFSIMRRKHHCRSCGRVFCSYCSSRKTVIPGFNTPDTLHRVCDSCYSVLTHQSTRR